jgi:hypothetical protein
MKKSLSIVAAAIVAFAHLRSTSSHAAGTPDATSEDLAERACFANAFSILQRSIAEDTVHNEYRLHARIHGWFANGTAPENLDALNAKIYAEFFLTPNSDAWLGLGPADAYSALDGGGLVQTKTS